MRTACPSNEYPNPIQINLAVIGLSGTSQVKGVSGIGKSSICNRLVRPEQHSKQISSLTTVDFYSDIINGSHWIYWDYILKIVDSKSYAFHIIEQTILINEQTFAPFENYTESEYISRAISGKLSGSKRAYICPSQFSKTQSYEASLIGEEISIDAFLIVYDVSEVVSRNYQAQDRVVTELLNGLWKIRKPLVVVTAKTDVSSQKIRSRLDGILDKRNFKSIPLVETSAKLNVNIESIFSTVAALCTSGQKIASFHTVRQISTKIDPYDTAAEKQRAVAQRSCDTFRQLVFASVDKHYDVSWTQFCADNDLTPILAVVERAELRQLFEACKSDAIAEINERITALFVVLMKKAIFEFADPIFDDLGGDKTKITNELLNNSQFLSRFNGLDLPYDELMKSIHFSAQIDYPLPRFFIATDSPHNKLSIIDSCIEELKNQKRMSEFSEELLGKFEANSDFYLDMSFTDVEKRFKDDPMWTEFAASAKMTFNEFVENAVKQFKKSFDEKLLELSFMVYAIEPMKITIQRESKKKKVITDNNLDMSLIESINNKIYFENESLIKPVFNKNRIKWIVKYIGSILSTNPNQCYIYDFNPEACCEHLTKYLNTISKYSESLVTVISGDNLVDDFWRDAMITGVDLNVTVSSDNTYPIPIQFFPSTSVALSDFWENRFSVFQKVIFLINEDSKDTRDILNRLLNEEMVSCAQLSVINLASSSNSNTQFISEIKRWNIDYNFIGWNLCPGQHLKKLLNEQTNSFLCNTESVIIWMIVLCEDTFDANVPLSFFASIFQDHVFTDRNVVNGLLSISLYYIPPNTVFPHKLSLSIVSYHQAIKWLAEDNEVLTPHLLMYFCNLFRLASVNTMFAVMQNLCTTIDIKSIMCVVISGSSDHDPVDLKERMAMVRHLANDNVDCILIKDYELDEMNIQKLWSHIHNCRIMACLQYENKNLCCYNSAFENDDSPNLSRSKTYDETSKFLQSKECAKFREDGAKKYISDHKSWCHNSPLMNRSNSQYSPYRIFCDTSMSLEKIKKSSYLDLIECDYSVPLGCCNEELFQPITEESTFDNAKVIEDENTVVYVTCINIEHIRDSSEHKKLASNSKKPLMSKIRSYSGPVQTNKSFTKKYSTSQGQGSQSQRFNKKSQSLTTSPLTSGVKQPSMCNICRTQGPYCECSDLQHININQVATTPSARSIKNIFSRIFLSERYNMKSAEDKHSIFRRSFKFPKRNSDRKGKPIPTKSGSDPQPASVGFDSTCLPLPHSISHSILDMRKKSKSIFPPKNV